MHLGNRWLQSQTGHWWLRMKFRHFPLSLSLHIPSLLNITFLGKEPHQVVECRVNRRFQEQSLVLSSETVLLTVQSCDAAASLRKFIEFSHHDSFRLHIRDFYLYEKIQPLPSEILCILTYMICLNNSLTY